MGPWVSEWVNELGNLVMGGCNFSILGFISIYMRERDIYIYMLNPKP